MSSEKSFHRDYFEGKDSSNLTICQLDIANIKIFYSFQSRLTRYDEKTNIYLMNRSNTFQLRKQTSPIRVISTQ